jgi:hypothetical protein
LKKDFFKTDISKAKERSKTLLKVILPAVFNKENLIKMVELTILKVLASKEPGSWAIYMEKDQ